jgi:hypothetical protein
MKPRFSEKRGYSGYKERKRFVRTSYGNSIFIDTNESKKYVHFHCSILSIIYKVYLTAFFWRAYYILLAWNGGCMICRIWRKFERPAILAFHFEIWCLLFSLKFRLKLKRPLYEQIGEFLHTIYQKIEHQQLKKRTI